MVVDEVGMEIQGLCSVKEVVVLIFEDLEEVLNVFEVLEDKQKLYVDVFGLRLNELEELFQEFEGEE